MKDYAVGRRDLLYIDPRNIVVEEGWNVRDLTEPNNAAHVHELSLSIRAVGVKMPLKVRIDARGPVLVDGHCRLAAVMKCVEEGIDIKSVPCISDNKESEADRVLNMIVANAGKALEVEEAARVVAKLVNGYNWSEKEVSDKIGRSTTYVRNLLDLQAAPHEVLLMVRAGRVSASLAIETLRAHGNDSKAAVETLKAGLEAAEAAGKTRATKKHVAGKKPSAAAHRDQLLSTLERLLAPDATPDTVDWARGEVRRIKCELGAA